MAMEWMAKGDTFTDLHGKEYIDCLGDSELQLWSSPRYGS